MERRKDMKSLILAIEIAELSGDNGLMASIADKAVLEALAISDTETAKSIVKKYPMIQVKYLFMKILTHCKKLNLMHMFVLVSRDRSRNIRRIEQTFA